MLGSPRITINFSGRDPFWGPASLYFSMCSRYLDFILIVVITALLMLVVIRPIVQSSSPVPKFAPDSLTFTVRQNSVSQSTVNPDFFYQMIIDNNLFRPLGWQPPRKQPDYTLIGTAVAQNVEDSKAFILKRRSNRLHIVKVDDVFGDALVKVIESKRVILNEAGKEIVLHGGKLKFY